MCNTGQTNAIYFGGTANLSVIYNWVNNTPSIGLVANGSGTIPSFTALNTSATPKVATITVTPTLNGCIGSSQSFTITVNPTPIIVKQNDQNVCNGSVNPLLNFSSNVTGTTFSWTNNTPTIGLPATGTTSFLPIFTAVNTGTSLVVATVIVTPTSNGCVGIPDTILITVKPTPTVTQPSNQVVCNGLSTTQETLGGSLVTGTDYNWTNNTPSIGLSASGTGLVPSFVAVNTGTSPLVATITITPIANGCSGSPKTFTITINPTPNITFSRVNEVICSGSSMSLVNITSTTVGTSITWSVVVPAGITGLVTTSGTTTIPSQTLTNTTSSPIVISFQSQANTTGAALCNGIQSTYQVTVNPAPVVNANSDQSVCSGSSTTAINFTGVGTAYRWTNSDATIGLAAAGTGNISSFSAINLTNATKGVNIIVTPEYTNGGVTCFGVKDTIKLTIYPKITLSSSLTATVCSNDTFKYQPLSNLAGVSYSWTRSLVTGISNGLGSGSGSISEVLNNTTNTAKTVIYNYTMQLNGCTYNQSVTVTVNPKPIIVKQNDQSVCNGSTNPVLNFSSNITGTTYSWTNNTPTIGLPATGTTSFLPFFTAVNTGTSSVVATVIVTPTSNGCVGIPDTILITVLPFVKLLSSDTLYVCSNDTFKYTAIANISGSLITWERSPVLGITNAFNTGFSTINEVLNNTTYNIITVVYKFTLIANGCVYSKNVILKVNPLPIAKIIFTDSIACFPFNLATTISGPQIISTTNQTYKWYANNVLLGISSTFPGFTLSNSNDSINIKLIVTSKYNCKSDSDIVVFRTFKDPKSQFVLSDTIGCSPLSVGFTNLSTKVKGQTYLWDFGNGVTSNLENPGPITYISNPNGKDTTYYISLKCIADCKFSIYNRSITVKAKPQTLLSVNKTIGCSPLIVTFTNLSKGVNNFYIIDYNDGNRDTSIVNTNFTHTFNTNKTDTFNVKLISMNSCGKDSQNYSIIVYPKNINANLTIDGLSNIGCVPHLVSFVSNSIGSSSHIYNFGDGTGNFISTKKIDTVYHNYKKSGVYNMTYFASNWCSDTLITRTVTVYDKPNADFTINKNSFCINEEISITNLSSISTSYTWDFDNGDYSSNYNPKYLYRKPGKYSIKLVVSSISTNGLICSDTAIHEIVIDSLIKPSLVNPFDSILCGTSLVNIISKNQGQFITHWQTGDSSNINDFNQTGFGFSHVYKKAGVYFIKQINYNNNGCADSAIHKLTVLDKPIIKLNNFRSVVCDSSRIQIINQTSSATTSLIKYIWFVNNKIINDSLNLTYLFVNNSSKDSLQYIIKLIAINPNGCIDSLIDTVFVRLHPISDFVLNSKNGCAPIQININNLSKYVSNYSWYVNNQLVSNSANPQIILDKSNKLYEIKLVVSNISGCFIDSTIDVFSTFPSFNPNLIFSDTLSCNGQLLLNIINTTSQISLNQYIFGDGNFSNSIVNSITYLYNKPGKYNFKYLGSNSFGCSDSVIKNINVASYLNAEYIPDISSSCTSANVFFKNNSKGYISCFWDFGDGQFSNLNSPTHLFTARINPYIVTLIVTGDFGCKDTFSFNVPIKISLPPVVDFAVDDTIKTMPYNEFLFISQSGFKPMSSYWDFGDGSYSTFLNPKHTYQYTGRYRVKLIQVDSNGCENYKYKDILLEEVKGNLWLPNAFTPNSGSDRLRQFIPLGYGLGKYNLQIYNSYGVLLFETEALDEFGRPIEAWLGKDKFGKDMPQGAYLWKIEAAFLNGNVWKGMKDKSGKLEKVGTLMLIR